MRSSHAPFPRILAFLACALALFFSSYSQAAPGALEQKSLLSIPGGDNNALTMTVQPDGKILAAGYAFFGTKQFAITRYNANGTVDTSFGDAGTRLEWLGPGNAEPHGIAVQSSGKIVVGGFAVSDLSRFGIARFNSDGTLDLTFGGGGAVTTIGTGAAALAMALQSDDKIILGGWSMSGGKKVFTLARYDANAPTLDTSFGSGGEAVAGVGTNDQQINSLAIQSDGKIVAAGSDGTSAVVVRRYNTNGSLDTSFASGGTFSSSSMAGARDLVILGNGDILVAGEVPGASSFEVARLTSAGALDTTFGVNGFAQQSVGGNTTAGGIAVQSDGKIVVAGTGGSSGPSVVVARFNADGSNDTGFGSSGVTVHQFTTAADEGNDVAILSSGRIVVAGTGGTPGSHDSRLAGFTTAGALDSSFGSSGSVVVDAGSKQSVGRASALQSDGKLVVAGYDIPTPTATSVKSTLVARYNTNGSLDTSFGTNGFVELGPDVANGVAIQSDGKIVVAGWAIGTFGGTDAHRVAVSRLLSNGTLDTSFGGTGTVFVPLASTTEEANAVAIQGDGKIVVGGRGLNGSFLDAMFVRFNTNGSLDTGFGGTGKVFVTMSTGADQVNAIAIQGDGKIVGAGFASVSSSQNSVALARLNTNGSADTGFGTGGVVVTSIGTTISIANAVALQGDGKIVIGGQWFNPSSTTDDFLVARYNTNGTIDGTFGSGGKTTTDAGNHNRLFSLAILANGKIVGSGLTADGFALAQYLSDGTLDTSFGTNGTVYQPINAGADVGYSIHLRSDGKLWVAGDGTNLLAAAVFTGDGGSTPKSSASAVLASSANPSTAGQSVTFSASVSGGVGTPTGTVTFLDGSTPICSSVALTAGGATCATSSLSTGSHSISASYSGDTAYNPTTSNVVTQTVNTAPAQFTLSITKSGTGSGTVTSSPVGINCGATCSASFTSGTTVSLSAAGDAGSSFAGWSGGGCSGTGSCTVTMNAATTVSATFNANSNPARLGNLSTRGDVLSGADVMIGGFVISGSTPKTVIVRGIGPSLANFGITNALSNPTLTLVRSSDQSTVAVNDDWGTASNAAQIQADGFAPSDARESAILITLDPGAYTAIVSGVSGATGVGLAEVYEIDHPDVPLINISTRGHVGSNTDVMIGGFVITGSASQTVVVRGIGPSLANFGIPSPLQNPRLQLVRMSDGATIATNDDWQSDASASQVQADGFAPSDPREAAIKITLPPGAYTAIVSGADGGSGTGMVEVYRDQ